MNRFLEIILNYCKFSSKNDILKTEKDLLISPLPRASRMRIDTNETYNRLRF